MNSAFHSVVPGRRTPPELLGKQFGVRPPGWLEATGIFGAPDTFRSIADVVDADSLRKVREFKQAQKAAARSQA